MKVTKTVDGYTQVRLLSTEIKPTGNITAWDNTIKGHVDTHIQYGDELIELDTGDVYLYTGTEWHKM